MKEDELDKEIRRKNLNKIALECGSQREFADKLDQTPGYINQLLSGHRSIGEKAARKIERTLNLEKYELEKVENNNIESPTTSYTANIESGPDIKGRVPLISWVQAGEWSEIINNFLPGEAEEWRLTAANVSKNAFSLRVKGDSMTNPYGTPSIPDGSIIIVDPNVQHQNKSIVVARLEDNSEATLKMLVVDGNQQFLKPLNPAYPIIAINGNCHIVGTAVKVEFDL